MHISGLKKLQSLMLASTKTGDNYVELAEGMKDVVDSCCASTNSFAVALGF